MKSDIEIAQEAVLRPISDIAASLGIAPEHVELYGPYKAKISPDCYVRLADRPEGRLILVTAITPTPAGEGKSTTTVGLGQAIARLGRKVAVTLREPSLGPVFGLKGGATGGGYSQVVPMEDINLHFTGDIPAVTAAHNLLAAVLDNHLHQGNALGIDSRRVTWRRVMDMNDRALRNIVIGLGGKAHGVPREDGFEITVASEVMAILCLAESMHDLKERLGRIIVAYTYDGEPVTAARLGVAGAMAVLLKDAIKPNLVQTLEHVPAFIHGGPFANIAHGCNSVMATKLALKLADYVVTEAGFGADLGAEKFFDIKCRSAGLRPAAAVVVATVRALKMHGGVARQDLGRENVDAVTRGLANLAKHLENVAKFGVPACVAVNVFPTDTQAELHAVLAGCQHLGVPAALSRVWEQGGAGGEELAKIVLDLADSGAAHFHYLYDTDRPLAEKAETIAREMYGADGVVFTRAAATALANLERQGFGHLPVCMAKTQYSLSDDPTRLGRPTGFTITVRQVRVSAGAGFVVMFTGDILTMPGLPKEPAALAMDIDDTGRITGLF